MTYNIQTYSLCRNQPLPGTLTGNLKQTLTGPGRVKAPDVTAQRRAVTGRYHPDFSPPTRRTWNWGLVSLSLGFILLSHVKLLRASLPSYHPLRSSLSTDKTFSKESIDSWYTTNQRSILLCALDKLTSLIDLRIFV